MKGKSSLFTAVLDLIIAGLNAMTSGSPYNLGTILWLGTAGVTLSFFALENSWKKLSLGLFVCDLVTCFLVSLSLANRSGVAISIWFLIFPVVLLSYWHHYKEKV